MAKKYYSTLTKIGLNAVARATTMNEKVKFSKFCLGDAEINPDVNTTALGHEVWQGSISSIVVDENNPNWIVLTCIISATVGGFTIREVGIKDEDGNLLAVASYPETYKPVLAEGAGKDLIVRVILEVSNTDVVELKIDPTVSLATKKDLEAIENRKADKEDVKNLEKKVEDAEKKVETVEQKVTEGVENLDVSEKQVEFAEAATRILPQTGDTLKTIVAKITKYLKDLKTVAFTGKYSDLTGIPESFPPASHNHDDRYLGITAKAESAKTADSATTAEQVQGFQFRSNSGKLEVLVEGKWIPVGGRQYTEMVRVTKSYNSGPDPKYHNNVNDRILEVTYSGKSGIVRRAMISNNASVIFYNIVVDGKQIFDVNSAYQTSAFPLLKTIDVVVDYRSYGNAVNKIQSMIFDMEIEFKDSITLKFIAPYNGNLTVPPPNFGYTVDMLLQVEA